MLLVINSCILEGGGDKSIAKKIFVYFSKASRKTHKANAFGGASSLQNHRLANVLVL